MTEACEPLDKGYSPPERWPAGQRLSDTAYKEVVSENLAERLAQEESDVSKPAPCVWSPRSAREGRLQRADDTRPAAIALQEDCRRQVAGPLTGGFLSANQMR